MARVRIIFDGSFMKALITVGTVVDKHRITRGVSDRAKLRSVGVDELNRLWLVFEDGAADQDEDRTVDWELVS